MAASDDKYKERAACEIRFGESLRGHTVPFGARIYWERLNPDLDETTAKFEQTTR